MKDIQFRAWDKKDKRMIMHEQNFIPFLKVTNIGVFRLNPSIEEENWELMDRDRFELMQYTGLKDKNGKEIYDCDIISVKYNIADGVDKRGDRFKKITLNNLANLSEFLNEVLNGDSEFGVIGNIYENLELIK